MFLFILYSLLLFVPLPQNLTIMKKTLLTLCAVTAVIASYAQGPNASGTYYKAADGKSGQELKTALHNIIKEPEVTSYNGLWEAYRLTDMTPDGKVWDMYSDLTSFTDPVTCSHSYSKEGDGLNREHSFPKSWFGGSDKTLMYSDVQHVIPTDGYVNMQRSNYPYGEVYSPSYVSHNSFSKLGPCAEIGYTKKVFEPNDEYKGDLARIYFYMATCYEDVITDWYQLGQTDILTNNSYKPYVNWHMQMLMRWAKEDAVSDKEVERNHGCYRVQGNRNPFIDYPGLEDYIWGDKVGQPFNYDVGGSGTWDFQFKKTQTIESGKRYLIVAKNTDKATQTDTLLMMLPLKGYGYMQKRPVTEEFDIINYWTDKNTFTFTAVNGGYTIQQEDGKYLCMTTRDNGSYYYSFSTSATMPEKAGVWTVTPNADGTCKIMNKDANCYVQYSTSYYTYGSYPNNRGAMPALYVETDVTGIHSIENGELRIDNYDYFNLSGQRVGKDYKGIVIKNGKKYVQK